MFLNATWYRNQSSPNYGGYYTDQLIEATGMTVEEVATLYQTTPSTTFGALV
jgi:hypothetical protein